MDRNATLRLLAIGGAVFLFFMFVTAYLVVASAVLNRSLHDELSMKDERVADGATRSAETSPA